MKLSKKNIILLSSALVAFVGILILIILLSISCNKKTTQIELNKTTYTFNNTHSTHVNATVTNPIGDTTWAIDNSELSNNFSIDFSNEDGNRCEIIYSLYVLSEVTFNLTATNNGTNASCSITLKTDSAPATVTSYEISTPTFTIDYVKNSAITSSVTLTTIDSNGDTITNNLTYSIYPTLPNGITIDPNTGVISGTATDWAFNNGNYWITPNCTDYPTADVSDFQIQIRGDYPTFKPGTSTGDGSFDGIFFTFNNGDTIDIGADGLIGNVSGTPISAPDLVYSCNQSDRDGLSFNSSTGRFSGTYTGGWGGEPYLYIGVSSSSLGINYPGQAYTGKPVIVFFLDHQS